MEGMGLISRILLPKRGLKEFYNLIYRPSIEGHNSNFLEIVDRAKPLPCFCILSVKLQLRGCPWHLGKTKPLRGFILSSSNLKVFLKIF